MRDPDLILDEPPAELRFRRRVPLRRALRDMYRSRSLIRTLAERDLRARYKQAMLGFVWALLNPLVLVVAFTILFDRVTKLNTGGIPYPLFSYVALIPWNFFQSGSTSGMGSLLNNLSLLNKMPCPREVFTLSAVAGSLVDSLIAVLVLPILLSIYAFGPKATSPLVVLAFPALVLFTVGVALFSSAVVVYLRDLRHGYPILMQLALFATPVAYGVDNLPRVWRPVVLIGNPAATVIDTFRRTLLIGRAPQWGYLGAATAVALVVFLVAYWMFKRLETGIADVA